MSAAAYFSAAVPEPFRVLGLPLRPLSLGRYRLLHRFNCAFVSEGTSSATVGDLLIGALICSMRVDQFLIWANSSDFYRDVKAWGRRVSPWQWLARIPGLARWWRRHFSFDAREKIGLFSAYVREGSVVPKFWDESGPGSDGSGSGSAWSQSVEVALRGELNWSAEEINEEPLSKALADY